MHPGGCFGTTWKARLKALADRLLLCDLTPPRKNAPRVVSMSKSPSVSVRMCALSVATLPTATRMLPETSCNADCRYRPGRGLRRAEERGLCQQVSHLRR